MMKLHNIIYNIYFFSKTVHLRASTQTKSSVFIIVHLYLLINLRQKPLSGIIAQVKLLSELVDNLVWVIIFKYTYLFHILTIKLNFQNTNRLFNYG